MMKMFPSSRRDPSAATRTFKRAALFSGGAVAGIVVSALSGYALVSVLYPAAPQSAVQTAAVQPPPSITAPVTEPTEVSAPAMAALPAESVSMPSAARLPVAPEVEVQVDAPTPDVVVASKSAPEAELPMPTAAADDVALFTVAAMARQDATRDVIVPGVRPEPRPEDLVVASAPTETTPAIAPVRPRPRPENVVLAVMRTEVPEAAPQIPGIRPQPRPDNIVLAGARAPAAERRSTTRLFGGSSGDCSSSLARAMPRRPSGAPGGTDFFAALGNASGSTRDNAVINELARGNMPDFMHQLQPVTFRGKDSRGADTEIVICVTPDYLALGSDRDYVRVPLGLPAAASIAKRFDMTLPTPQMVDAIYAQADVRLSPSPMTPGPQMSSTAYLLQHNATIERQLGGRGGLIAGQKKDVVMANRMASAPGRVAIYGWHRSSGSPIQPVSTVHGANYADYSHGIRLVSKTAYLNGRAVDLDDLLASRQYASLLNKDGPVPAPVIRIASR